MKKIVLALALTVVTPAVLVAQENGNAYNQSSNEVIAPVVPTQTASIASFGPEGKMLSLADLTLAKIRAHRAAKKAEKPQTQKVKTDTTSNPHNAYYVYSASEGKMMIHSDLPATNSRPKREKNTPAANTDTARNTQSNNYYEYTGREGHMMALGHGWNNDTKHDTTPIPTYVKEADTLSHNHQVVVNADSSNKSVKKRNTAFRRFANEVAQSIIRNAQYEK